MLATFSAQNIIEILLRFSAPLADLSQRLPRRIAYPHISKLDATMGAKAPIFSEFGAKARILFRLAPPKKEKQRLSTIANATLGAKAHHLFEFGAEGQLPRKTEKQPNYKQIV